MYEVLQSEHSFGGIEHFLSFVCLFFQSEIKSRWESGIHCYGGWKASAVIRKRFSFRCREVKPPPLWTGVRQLHGTPGGVASSLLIASAAKGGPPPSSGKNPASSRETAWRPPARPDPEEVEQGLRRRLEGFDKLEEGLSSDSMT